MVTTKHRIRRKTGFSCAMPGVWRAVAHNEGAVVIFHSPKACAHIGQEMELSAFHRSLARKITRPLHTAVLLASGLTEEHAVFGGMDQLRECIDYAAKTYQPQYLVIANSCVAGVVGDDTEAVARQAAVQWQLSIIVVPYFGFLDGDYYAGFYHTAWALAEQFMQPLPKQCSSVVLLGDGGGPDSDSVTEIKMLLAEFNLTVLCQFPVAASVSTMRRLPAAQLAIPLAGNGMNFPALRNLGQALKQAFAVEFFDVPYPVGWQATKGWLISLGDTLNQHQVARQVLEGQWTRLEGSLKRYCDLLQSKQVVLCVGRPLRYFDPSWIIEILGLAKVTPTVIVLLDELDGAERQAVHQVLSECTKIPIIAAAEANSVLAAADLVVTTHELLNHGKRQLFLPLLPAAGVGGILALLRKLAYLAKRPGSRGGIIYG